MEVVIVGNRQTRAGCRVEAPFKHVTLNNQRPRNTTLDRTLAFRTDIDKYRLRFFQRLIGFVRSEPSQSCTRRGKHTINGQRAAVRGFASLLILLLIQFLSPLRRTFAWDQLIAVQIVLLHIGERGRIGVNADGRCEGDIADVMSVLGAECARLAWNDRQRLYTRTMLLKNAGRYDESSRGFTVVVKAGGLPGHPAYDPDIVVLSLIQSLIPAIFDAQPHPIHPPIGGREMRDDVGKFFRRS